MQRVNWGHLFLQDRIHSSCESASRNLSLPVCFAKVTFNIISKTGKEFYFIFDSDVLKHSEANTVAFMFGRGKQGKERNRTYGICFRSCLEKIVNSA